MSHLMTDTYKTLLFYLLANMPEFYFILFCWFVLNFACLPKRMSLLFTIIFSGSSRVPRTS